MRAPATGEGADRPRRGRGFTLIEVLVALAIFGMAAVVLASAYVNVLRAYVLVREADENLADVAFVRSVLLAEAEREKAEKGGDVPLPDGRRAQWRAEIEPAGVLDLFNVRFTCEIDGGAGGGEDHAFEENFRLLRPSWSEETEQSRALEAAKKRLALRDNFNQ